MSMDARQPLRLGVYVITSADLFPGRGHRDVALAAIEGGADAIQLRAPELSDDELLRVASGLAAACRAARVLFVVNNRVDVAAESGAVGAHVGQGDDMTGARRRLGSAGVLGVSVANPEEAHAAEAVGADYLGVTVWATPTKPEAVPRGVEGLRAVVEAATIPVVGIGGIDAGNAEQVLAVGAVGVAVISAVGAADDPVAATRDLVDAVRGWKAGNR
jgi:thiamine-phosphate pyrophosphorylase